MLGSVSDVDLLTGHMNLRMGAVYDLGAVGIDTHESLIEVVGHCGLMGDMSLHRDRYLQTCSDIVLVYLVSSDIRGSMEAAAQGWQVQ